jgi:hypothetical protein
MGWFRKPTHIERDIVSAPTEPKALDPSQIYTLLDNRARDYRTILLGFMAGIIALTIATLNAAAPCLDSKYEHFYDCPTWKVPSFYLSLVIGLALVAIFKIGREVATVKNRAEYVRQKFIINADDVPVIDGLLPRNTKIYDYNEVERQKRIKAQREKNGEDIA